MNRIAKRCAWVFLVLSVGSIGSGPAFAESQWEELPTLVFQESVLVETVAAPNPYSRVENDFIVVTKYEEDGQKAGGTGKARAKRGPVKFTGVYLVTGLILMDDGNRGVPYHRSLVVSVRNTNSDSREQIVRQWILSDTDNDGKVDQGRFQRVVKKQDGERIPSDPVDISEDQVRNYQSYFEKAARDLNKMAEFGK